MNAPTKLSVFLLFFGALESTPVLSDNFIHENESLLGMRKNSGPPNDACQKAWETTRVRSQCTGDGFTQQYPAGICVMWKSCLKSGNTSKYSGRYEFPIEDVPKINNCNGVLKTSEC
ncbi:hypothetical protein [Pseudomonas mucidolens]|uniref:Uncharacterized protein n=1 Tax=Pseudomonas mucidolens TaxID=46679 RepID=A0A1H2NLH4_9PSED|nr:hypothetical protein [Pseudomonas mucidolens]SDV06337.1 hypothetical protein SAMN05216202_4081 [Pseudomonas mucidolens]SQH31606.1 Uncharacterised protein [Pseudomonas mucidolens]